MTRMADETSGSRRRRRPPQRTVLPVVRTDRSYAAKLLFQFRVVMEDGGSNQRRLTEERIIVLEADQPRQALAAAKRHGRAGEHNYPNDHGDDVRFEFVGVLDMRRLGPEYEPNEVWYEIRRRVNPMERRDDLVPADATLLQWAT